MADARTGEPADDRADDAAGLDAVRRWLARELGAPDLTVRPLARAQDVGHSSETLPLLLDLGGGRTERVVVRAAPTEDAVFPRDDLSRQVAGLRAAAAAGAAVPEVRFWDPEGVELGRPAMVMAHVAGDVPADRLPYTLAGWLHDADPADQARLWWSTLEAMATLHRAPLTDVARASLGSPDHGDDGVDQHLGWWSAYARWVAAGRSQPTIEAAEVWLRDRRPVGAPDGIVWGDARLSNVLYDDFRAVALLDWELAAVGPAELDLGWMLFFQRFFAEGLGVDDLPGLPPRAASVERYASLLGRPLVDLAWFEAFAAWRHAAIMARIADRWEAAGDLPPGSGARDNNPATRLLAAATGLPSPGPPGGPMG